MNNIMENLINQKLSKISDNEMMPQLIMKKYFENSCSNAGEMLRDILPENMVRSLNFTCFEIINAALISKAIKEDFNLQINFPANQNEKNDFYKMSIILSSIFSFQNNLEYKTEYKIGDIVQKDAKRGEIISYENGYYTIQSIDKFNTKDTIPRDYIQKYIITNGKLSPRKLKLKFDKYREFFTKTFKLGEYIPSKFKYKTVIIAAKEITESLKDYQIDGENIYKAFPFEYINSKGKSSHNLPMDSLVYLVNNLDTAMEYIFDDDNLRINNLIIIGSNKYSENIGRIENLKRSGKISNYILIGENKSLKGETYNEEHKDLLSWEWTMPEINYYKQYKEAKIKLNIVEDPNIQELRDDLTEYIKSMSEKLNLRLSSVFFHLRNIDKLVYPGFNNPESRLNNQAEEFMQSLSQDNSLEEEFSYNSSDISLEEFKEALEKKFSILIENLNEFNPKYLDLANMKYFDYLVVPRQWKEAWAQELKNYKRLKIISFKEIPDDDNKYNILMLALYGFNQIKKMMSTKHDYTIMSYPEEKKLFNKSMKDYKQELFKKFSSPDRTKLLNLEFPLKKEDLLLEEDKFINELYEETIIGNEYSDRKCSSNVRYLLSFESGKSMEIDASRSVLVYENRELNQYKVSALKSGDKVRIYQNINRDTIWHFARTTDPDFFTTLDQYSALWKKALIKFHNDNFNNLENLHFRLQQKGAMIKSELTLKKWLDLNDKDMFPVRIISLKAIRDLTNDPDLISNFNQILKYKKEYRSIMIEIGKNLSEEITEYIQTGKKGSFLANFSQSELNKIISENSPEEIISDIRILIENE